MRAEIVCTCCGETRTHHAVGMCMPCYSKHVYRKRMSKCVHCRQMKYHRARGLCSACYNYQSAHGRPRPERLWQRVSFAYFSEEWDHMTRKVGLPEAAALYRLSDAFKMEVETLERYAERYRAQQAVAA